MMDMNTLMDFGGGVGLIWTVIIGGLAGWGAEKISRSDMGIMMNIVVGIIGAYVGRLVFGMLDIRIEHLLPGWFWSNLLVALAGALILIYVVRLLRSSKSA